MDWSHVALVLLLLVAAAVYAVRFYTAHQVGVSQDDAEYLVLAESFATGHPYRVISYPGAPLETVWPPGYPLLVLTVPWLLFGPNYTLLRAINVLLAGATALLGYRVLRFGLPKLLAFAAVALFVLNPGVIGATTILMSDIAFTFFTMAFLLAFTRWQSGTCQRRWWAILSVALLASAILIRYQGVAFLAAAALYLLLKRHFASTFVLVGGVLLVLLPFPIFLALQATDSPGSFLAVRVVSRELAEYVAAVRLSIVTYWRAIPLALVPALGPRVSAALGGIGLAWAVDVIHSVLLLIVAIGACCGIARQRLFALWVGCYLVLILILTHHYGDSTRIFDEPRYLVPILLFLYAYFLLGLHAIAVKVMGAKTGRWVSLACVVLLIGVFVMRNVQQATADFPVADLSAGAEWAQAETDPDAVFMTSNPVERYIHLRRHTVDYPDAGAEWEFWAELTRWDVAYLLIAPPLVLDSWANVDRLPDPKIEIMVLPLIARNPDCFALVFEDQDKATLIYKVIESCPQLQSAE